MTEDVQETAPQETPARRRRLSRPPTWLTAVVTVLVVLGGGAWTAVVAHRDHWLDAQRQITMHELNILSHPDGFHQVAPTATDPGPAGWDAAGQLGRRYYDGTLVPKTMTADLDFWLGRGGVLTADGPRESQRCVRVTLAGAPTFGCGNFYRETPEWRVWIEVSGAGWPGKSLPANNKPAQVHLLIVVQHKHPLAKQWAPLPLVSPGLTSTLAAGQARTVLSLTAAQAMQVDLDGATFGQQGQLVTAGPGLPAVIPAAAGAAAQLLTYTSWPTVKNEVGSAQVNDTTTDVARIGPDGSLWAHFPGYGLRQLDPDGHASNITGVSNGDGSLVEGPAIGQDPYPVAEPTAISADGTVWVANGQLVRIRTGKLHVIDPTLHGIASVVSDGHDGVWFATATQVFHLNAQGVRTQAGQAAQLSGVTSIALAKDGSVWVLDGSSVRRLLADGAAQTMAGRGGTVAGRDDPVFCALPVPTAAARLAVSAAYDVIASPLGGVFLTGCNRLVQIG